MEDLGESAEHVNNQRSRYNQVVERENVPYLDLLPVSKGRPIRPKFRDSENASLDGQSRLQSQKGWRWRGHGHSR